ncbi:MAG: permease-like cell division protein FtsX [Crocinitomicaceae bacterium]|nr:permease-like cell division protein FtsX [Crocinitomicaceae bacterium]
MSTTAEKYSKKGVRTSYISTVIGISLVLFMIGLVLAAVFGLENVQRQAKESLQGDLFFKPEVNNADIKQIEQELKTWSQFSAVYYVSPDRAIEEFSGTDQNAGQILGIFEGDNPLPSTISFRPKAEHATKQGMEKIKLALLKAYPDQLDEVNYDKSSVASVNIGFKQFVLLFLVVALLLITVAVAMINNTIRLALYSKRFTIKTMQLVGATSGFIRKPFIFQSIFQGVISALIGLGLLLTLFYALNNVLSTLEISFSMENFLILSFAMILIGIVITVISTWLALNKYLRMKLDDLY